MTPLSISVSGIRGVFPRPLSPALARRFAHAYGVLLAPKVAFLATDTRSSGLCLARASVEGLARAGVPVRNLGIAPTPSVQFAVEHTEGAGGVIITASHNPLPCNGLKFLSRCGSFLDREELARLVRIADTTRGKALRQARRLPPADPAMVRAHLDAVVAAVDADAIRRRRFSVVVDPVQGTGAVWTRLFLKTLGCRVRMVNDRPLGRFSRNPEPLAVNLGALCRTVRACGADIGFAQDPDADRLACVSEKGEPAGEEFTLVLAAERALAYEATPVVVNLSTSALIETVARRRRVPVYRTPVGEAHVAKKMRETGSRFGGEGNGGVMWSRVHTGRDSFVAMALILDLLATDRMPLSSMLARYPQYVMLKEKVEMTRQQADAAVARARERYRGSPHDCSDGLRVVLPEGWIHIRPSGTEPVVRIIVEGVSRQAARRLLDEALSACLLGRA